MTVELPMKLFLLRWFLPLVLLAACLARINALSAIYGLMLLLCLLIPDPKEAELPWATKRYFQGVVLVAFSCSLSLLLFHVALLMMPPYGADFKQCSYHELLARQLGFQRLDIVPGWHIVRLISPELLVCSCVVHCYMKCRSKTLPLSHFLIGSLAASRIMQSSQRAYTASTNGMLYWRNLYALQREALRAHSAAIANIATTVLLALAGIVHPSILSIGYFSLFLCEATLWAVHREMSRKTLMRCNASVLIVVTFHLIFLYLYQFPVFQDALPPQSLGARLIGLMVLVRTPCTEAHAVHFDQSATWAHVANACLLMVLYAVLAFQIREYFWGPPDSEEVREFEERIPKETVLLQVRRSRSIRHPSTRRRESFHPDGSHRGYVVTSSSEGLLNGITPTVGAKEDRSRSSSPRATTSAEKTQACLGTWQGKAPICQLSRTVSRRHSSRPQSQAQVQRPRRHSKIFATGLQALRPTIDRSWIPIAFQFITKHSYVVSLVTMMAWSITYHSWFTLVLLILSCLVWMVPNSRQFCLKLSPFLVIYAEFMLLLQFLYGLNTTEAELPDEKPLVLRQIGMEKSRSAPPCVPLFIKTLFTALFWLTLRQFVEERRMLALTVIGKMLVESPFHVVLSTTHSDVPQPRLSIFRSPSWQESGRVNKFGIWLTGVLQKYWIFISAAILLFIALRPPVAAYRIIYMMFFLAFITVFQQHATPQVAVTLVTVASIVQIVLTLMYTFQFYGFPEMWQSGTGWSLDALNSLGLEKYSSGELFLKLCSPISFLIITIIQLNFFHKDLLKHMENIEALKSHSHYESADWSRRHNKLIANAAVVTQPLDSGQPMCETTYVSAEDYAHVNGTHTPTDDADQSSLVLSERAENLLNKEKEESMHSFEKTAKVLDEQHQKGASGPTRVAAILKYDWMVVVQKYDRYRNKATTIAWRLLEIHMGKLIAFAMMLLCVNEVSALNFPYMILIALHVPLESRRLWLNHAISVWTSCVIVAKMIYQMKFVKEQDVVQNCTIVLETTTFYKEVNATVWIGLHKAVETSAYLKGYIGLLLLLTLQTLVVLRHEFRKLKCIDKGSIRGILFENITRNDADRGIPSCLLYFANYFFYKFGLEICYLTTIVTVGVRNDMIAVLYCVWLLVLLSMSRKQQAKIWPAYVAFQAVMLPVQYLLCIGLPPTLCAVYPWAKANKDLIEWLFLPDYVSPPYAMKLAADFMQFLFASCQLVVFKIEMSPNADTYPGGSNAEMDVEDETDSWSKLFAGGEETGATPCLRDWENPVPDFITYPKSYLDLVKIVLFLYLYWATLAVVFVAGTSRVTLFAMGYVVASFLFLWNGNELFLRSLPFALKLWNLLIGYNVAVMFLKTSLQVVGCVYLDNLYRNYCWVIQLLGIACLKTSKDPKQVLDPTILAECNVPTEEAGIFFDGICFFFLLLQRRMFASNYFKHVLSEFRAQQVFASRGAELISQIMSKEIAEQLAREQEIVAKIKRKMEKIRQSQGKRGARPSAMSGGSASLERRRRFPRTHHEARHSVLKESEMSSYYHLFSADYCASSAEAARGRQSACRVTNTLPASASLANSHTFFPEDTDVVELFVVSVGILKMLRLHDEASTMDRQLSYKASYIPSPGALSNVSVNEAYSPSDSMAMDQFVEPTKVSLKDSLAQTPAETDLRLPVPDQAVPFLPTPEMIKAQGCAATRSQMLRAPGPHPPVAHMESLHTPDFSEDTHSEEVKLCHLVGPDILLSPASQMNVPFATSTEPSGIDHTSIVLTKPMTFAAHGADRPFIRPDHELLGPKAPRGSQECMRYPVDQYRMAITIPQTIRETTPKHRRHALAPSPELASRRSSMRSAEPYLYTMDESSDSDMSEELGDLDGVETTIIPDANEDRRKGLGPLQLLNAAFRRGGLKEAVEDSQNVERRQLALERQMSETFGRTDRKTVRRRLKESLSSRQFADFEEATFDDDHVGPEVVGRHRRSKDTPERDEDVYLESVSLENVAGAISRPRRISLHVPGDAHTTAAPVLEQNLEPEVEETVTSDEPTIWTTIVDRLRGSVVFAQLFFLGVIESTITWLLKCSRNYRYVAQVLGQEKRIQKQVYMSEQKINYNHEHGIPNTSTEVELEQELAVLKDLLARRKSVRIVDHASKQFGDQQNIFVRLIIATYYLIISRSELFCYLMMVLMHMASASLMSMVLPLLAFLWGTLSVPRPTRLFWISVITYTEVMVVVKYLFQFGFFPWNKTVAPADPLWPPRILGIEKKPKYAGWDLALLMILFFHRSTLKSLGLWKDTKLCDQPGSVNDEARGRMSLYSKASLREGNLSAVTREPQLSPIVSQDEGSPSLSEDEDETEDEEISEFRRRRERWRKGIASYVVKFLRFFQKIFAPRYRYSVDVYAPMFLCDFVCFLTVVFGYWAFGTDDGSGGVASYFEENKVPAPFLAMLIVQFAWIIIDRALFLRKFLFGKLIYQLLLTGFIHVWMFLILPRVTDRLFVDSMPVKVWYFIKCVYFCLSAWQIRSGYPQRILGNFLTKKYNLLNMILFKGFMYIPFLFELRALMDWIWTDTSMSLFDWLKLEDIYANVYQIKCQRKFEENYPTPRGAKRGPLLKYLAGGSALFVLFLIIWFPLVVFSMANQVGMRDLPVECTVRFSIDGYEPLFQITAMHSDLQQITETDYDSLKFKHRHSKYAQNYMGDYSSEDVIKAKIDGNSSKLWTISPAARHDLLKNLHSTLLMQLTFDWEFRRLEGNPPFQPKEIAASRKIVLEPGSALREQLANVISDVSGEQEQRTVIVPHLYPLFVKLPSKGKSGPVTPLLMDSAVDDDLATAFLNVSLTLAHQTLDGYVAEWWQLSVVEQGATETKLQPYLTMIGFADKVFPSTFNMITGGGIISLYLSLVLVVGRFVRMLVTGSMEKIMFEELPNVDRVLQLCLDIFLVREAGELELEEDLFAKLIFLYRSPATLIKWTRKKS